MSSLDYDDKHGAGAGQSVDLKNGLEDKAPAHGAGDGGSKNGLEDKVVAYGAGDGGSKNGPEDKVVAYGAGDGGSKNGPEDKVVAYGAGDGGSKNGQEDKVIAFGDGDGGPLEMETGCIIESNYDEVVDNFDAMNLKEELLRGIKAYGLEKPSAIQQRVIMPCIKERDMIVQAHSANQERTAAFSISILQLIDTSLLECQALILAPYRESVLKVVKVVEALGKFMNVKCHTCFGGTNVSEDKRKLKKGVHVVVGTPGRVYDMIRRNALRTTSLKIILLEESDIMFGKGFKGQVDDIFNALENDVQVVVLAARLPDSVIQASKWFMQESDPVQIVVKGENLAAEGVDTAVQDPVRQLLAPGRLRTKKNKERDLIIENLKKESYLRSLKILKLERELNLPTHSSYANEVLNVNKK